MKIELILTGILKDKNEYLVVKRSDDDELYPSCWEFPGGHMEDGESIKDALRRELSEEIGFNDDFEPIIVNYSEEINIAKNIHNIEIDFIINVDKSKVNIKLSKEHSEYSWVERNSDLLDNYIKEKLKNVSE